MYSSIFFFLQEDYISIWLFVQTKAMEKSLLPLIFKEMEIQVLKNMLMQVFCYLIFHIYQNIYFLTNFLKKCISYICKWLFLKSFIWKIDLLRLQSTQRNENNLQLIRLMSFKFTVTTNEFVFYMTVWEFVYYILLYIISFNSPLHYALLYTNLNINNFQFWNWNPRIQSPLII